MFAGQMACEGLNWVLKRYIKEERPAQMLGKGYGMPSSHAQFVAFFAVYIGLWVVVRHDPWKANESKTHVPTPMWQRVGLAIAAMAGAVAVAQSRMYVSNLTVAMIPRALTNTKTSQLSHSATSLCGLCCRLSLRSRLVRCDCHRETSRTGRLPARLWTDTVAEDA